jgi:hypothetical protein
MADFNNNEIIDEKNNSFEQDCPKSFKEALVADIVSATLHYEELRMKFIEALEELRDLPRDEEDEGGVRSKDVAEQISIIQETMSQAAMEYGRIFMMDRTLEYIERKPSLDSLIWRHRFPGSLSKSLYLTEDDEDLLHRATRRKKVKKITDKKYGLMPYVEFTSETMNDIEFDEAVIRARFKK